MDLTVVSIEDCEPVDLGILEAELDKQSESHHKDVQARNAKFYNEQEDAVQRNREDRQAEFNQQVAKLEAELKDLRKRARNTDDPTESLRLKKRSNQIQQKIYDAEDDFARERRTLHAQSVDYLEAVEQALGGTEHVEDLFSVRWRVEP